MRQNGKIGKLGKCNQSGCGRCSKLDTTRQLEMRMDNESTFIIPEMHPGMQRLDAKPTLKAKLLVMVASILMICLGLVFLTVCHSQVDFGQRIMNSSMTVYVVKVDNVAQNDNTF